MAQMMGQDGAPAPEQAAPAEAGAEGGGSEVNKLFQNVSTGLTTVAELLGKVPDTPPEAMQLMEQAMQSYQQAIQMIMEAGGGEQKPAGPGGQAVSMEAGASGAQAQSPMQRSA